MKILVNAHGKMLTVPVVFAGESVKRLIQVDNPTSVEQTGIVSDVPISREDYQKAVEQAYASLPDSTRYIAVSHALGLLDVLNSDDTEAAMKERYGVGVLNGLEVAIVTSQKSFNIQVPKAKHQNAKLSGQAMPKPPKVKKAKKDKTIAAAMTSTEPVVEVAPVVKRGPGRPKKVVAAGAEPVAPKVKKEPKPKKEKKAKVAKASREKKVRAPKVKVVRTEKPVRGRPKTHRESAIPTLQVTVDDVLNVMQANVAKVARRLKHIAKQKMLRQKTREILAKGKKVAEFAKEKMDIVKNS